MYSPSLSGCCLVIPPEIFIDHLLSSGQSQILAEYKKDLTPFFFSSNLFLGVTVFPFSAISDHSKFNITVWLLLGDYRPK